MNLIKSQALLKQCPCCRAAAIHGEMDQSTRMEVLHGFKSGKFHVLVATDVAARGLDIKSIKTVRAEGVAGGCGDVCIVG